MIFFEIVKWLFLKEAFDCRFREGCGSGEVGLKVFISIYTDKDKGTGKKRDCQVFW